MNLTTIIVAFLSFILGLIGNLTIQWWVDRKRLKRIEGALKLHLTDIILKDCEVLRREYERIIVAVQQHTSYYLTLKVFETFDNEIYKANNPSDYYKIYGIKDARKFEKLVSIYSIISFLKENLPHKIHSDYITKIDLHLDKNLKDGESREEHFKKCNNCDAIRLDCKSTCQMRMNEIDELKKLIGELLMN